MILSGTASDGTLGLAAIKGEAGITFAQEPSSAKYDGMPASAIASGCVDFIMTPAGIAQEIARIRHHPYIADRHKHGAGARWRRKRYGADLSLAAAEDHGRFFGIQIAYDRAPHPAPHGAAEDRETQGLRQLSCIANRSEVDALYHDLLINVTSFFRNPEAFEALKHVVYPAILQARTSASGPIRIWVPGCSTGEEAYSHAISLVEYLGEERADIPIQVFGTDLSESAIQRARAGVYKENIEADVTAGAAAALFSSKPMAATRSGRAIRDLCIFSTQNVFNDPPFSRMDLVSCRNVMIYLSQVTAEKGYSDLSLRIESHRVPHAGKYRGATGGGFGAFRNDRQETENLS